MTLYLSLDQIIHIHRRQIEDFGGSEGIRDTKVLEAAVFRPQATFGGVDLYPYLEDKAAALMHSLVANHPFIDGNKRTGAMSAEVLLLYNGFKLVASIDDFETMTMATARGELAAEELAIWFRQRMEPLTR